MNRSYSATAPRSGKIWGIPTRTFIATWLSGGLYCLIVVLLLSVGQCDYTREKIWYLVSCLLALGATIFIFSINKNANRFRVTKVSLTASLLYSGAAGLVFWMLIHTFSYGICRRVELIEEISGADSISDFQEEVAPNGGPLDYYRRNRRQRALDDYPTENLFSQGNAGGIAAWILGVPAVSFQVVAHYYYA